MILVADHTRSNRLVQIVVWKRSGQPKMRLRSLRDRRCMETHPSGNRLLFLLHEADKQARFLKAQAVASSAASTNTIGGRSGQGMEFYAQK